MAKNLPDPNKFISPNQPPFIYPIETPWEEVIKAPPLWNSGKFPSLPKEKKYRFLGRDLISPIAIASGAAWGPIWVGFFFKMGYGMVIDKSKRTVPKISNKAPNICYVKADKYLTRKNFGKQLVGTMDPKVFAKSKTITNSFGIGSSDMLTWSKEVGDASELKKDGQLYSVSVTVTTPGNGGCTVILKDNTPTSILVESAGDLLMAASVAATHGGEVVELNLACPNVVDHPEEGELFQSGELVKYATAEFKRRFPSIPVGIKFGIYKSKDQMREVFIAGGDNLDYVSGINAPSQPLLGEDGSEILPGRRSAGICGWADREIALEHIKWADEIRKEEGLKYEILGCGGIVEVSDVDLYLKAGADMVQVATIALADPLFAYKYYLSNLDI